MQQEWIYPEKDRVIIQCNTEEDAKAIAEKMKHYLPVLFKSGKMRRLIKNVKV